MDLPGATASLPRRVEPRGTQGGGGGTPPGLRSSRLHHPRAPVLFGFRPKSRGEETPTPRLARPITPRPTDERGGEDPGPCEVRSQTAVISRWSAHRLVVAGTNVAVFTLGEQATRTAPSTPPHHLRGGRRRPRGGRSSVESQRPLLQGWRTTSVARAITSGANHTGRGVAEGPFHGFSRTSTSTARGGGGGFQPAFGLLRRWHPRAVQRGFNAQSAGQIEGREGFVRAVVGAVTSVGGFCRPRPARSLVHGPSTHATPGGRCGGVTSRWEGLVVPPQHCRRSTVLAAPLSLPFKSRLARHTPPPPAFAGGATHI